MNRIPLKKSKIKPYGGDEYYLQTPKDYHSMWMHMLQLFGMDWVMPSSIADLLFCWHHWLGKHNSNIWNLVLGCLMWTIWTEHNRRSFEDIEKSLVQLLDLCQRTLLDWSRCWGLSDCFALIYFLLSHKIVLWFLYFSLFQCCPLFTIVNSMYFFFYSFFNNITLLPIKKN